MFGRRTICPQDPPEPLLRQRCERYRSRQEFKLIPCGFLHWAGLQEPRGTLAAIYITLRRYLPTPHPAGSDRASWSHTNLFCGFRTQCDNCGYKTYQMRIVPGLLVPQPHHHLGNMYQYSKQVMYTKYNIVTRFRSYLHTWPLAWQPPIITVGRKPSEWRTKLADTDH